MFECRACLEPYNSTERIPLSLPCGHVYCKACLKHSASFDCVRCPADAVLHKVPLERLPYCYAILSHLPNPKDPGVSCVRHPNKRVKFACQVHNTYMCSNCVIDHTGQGHKVAAFTPNVTKMKREVDDLRRVAEEVYGKGQTNAALYQQAQKRLAVHYEAQVAKVKNSFEAAISHLRSKERDHVEALRSAMKDQQEALDQHRSRTAHRLESGKAWAASVKAFAENMSKLPYEKFIEFVTAKREEARGLADTRDAQVVLEFHSFNASISFKDLGSVAREKTETLDPPKCCCSGKTLNAACPYCKHLDFSASQNARPPEQRTAGGPTKKPSPYVRKPVPKHKQRAHIKTKLNNSF